MSALLKNIASFRPMRPEDLPEIMVIENEIYPFPWTIGNFRDSLQAGYSCWIYEDRQTKVAYGVMMMGANEAHLLNMSVAVGWQRQGIGSKLLNHFIELAREYKAEEFLLEVRPSNKAASELYKKFGFKQIGVRHNYYPAQYGREDAIIMSLHI
jgi:ribosomal-protein-alanine N-acetyltransferase